MKINRNGVDETASVPEEVAFTAHQATSATAVLAKSREQRAIELRQEAADLIDTSAGIDTTLPAEHRARELIMLNAAFSDLLVRARGRPLSGPEQAQLDGLRAVFEGAQAIRAAEAAARAEAAAAVDLTAVRAVPGVAGRLP